MAIKLEIMITIIIVLCQKLLHSIGWLLYLPSIRLRHAESGNLLTRPYGMRGPQIRRKL